MLTFNDLYMRNFMAIGNSGEKIDFKPGTTLINGHIGAGKTTILEALYYVIKGKVYKDKGKVSQLVNRINNKNCLVVVNLTNNDHDFKIERGMKPKKFNIFKDGKLIDKLSDAQQNNYISEVIFGFDVDLMFQLDVLGSNYEPILELSTSKRREFVEGIFELSIYSTMKDIVHRYAKDLQTEKMDFDSKIEKKELEIDYAEKLIEKSKEDRVSQLKEVEQEREDFLNEIDDLETKFSDIQYNSTLLTEAKNILENCNSDIRNIKDTLKRYNRSLDKFKSRVEEIDTGDIVCNECGQPIPENNIQSEREKLKLKISEIEKEIRIEQGVLDGFEKSKPEYINSYETLMAQRDEKRSLRIQIEGLNRQVGKIQKKIDVLQRPVKLDVDIDQLEKELYELEDNREVVLKRLNYFKFFKDDFLSDSGFKSFIISNYIPDLNKHVAIELQDYNIKCRLEFYPDFTYKIYDNRGDEIPYSMYSSGQKRLLNFSAWGAITTIVKNRRNVRTNLIFIDEVLDRSLDDESISIIMDKLEFKASKYNLSVFVVSHILKDHDRMIVVELNNDFSEYVFTDESYEYKGDGVEDE